MHDSVETKLNWATRRDMPVFIDTPEQSINDLVFNITGWVAGAVGGTARITVNDTELPLLTHERPDVRAVFSDLDYVKGVAATVALSRLKQIRSPLRIMLYFNGEQTEKSLPIDAHVQARLDQEEVLRLSHRSFCFSRLRCPECGQALDGTANQAHAVTCRACHMQFPQTTRAICMISGELAQRANLATTHLVSSNPYTPAALNLIERVTSGGGKVLDCGAGARPHRMEGVINAEIVDYESTDVLAVGESLPFADASFDAVLSLAVLEHVRDPFACARELLRVTKPGGELLVDVPFLQPVHGYPHHYYNMTAQGLENLFGDQVRVLTNTVPLHGHPIFGAQWLLRDYANGLPPGISEQFQNMTVRELIGLNILDFLADPRVIELNAETQRVIACLNSLHLKKQ